MEFSTIKRRWADISEDEDFEISKPSSGAAAINSRQDDDGVESEPSTMNAFSQDEVFHTEDDYDDIAWSYGSEINFGEFENAEFEKMQEDECVEKARQGVIELSPQEVALLPVAWYCPPPMNCPAPQQNSYPAEESPCWRNICLEELVPPPDSPVNASSGSDGSSTTTSCTGVESWTQHPKATKPKKPSKKKQARMATNPSLFLHHDSNDEDDRHLVIAAIKYLYAEKIKPESTVLRNQVSQEYAKQGREIQVWPFDRLEKACRSAPGIKIENLDTDAGRPRFHARLQEREDDFIDPESTDSIEKNSVVEVVNFCSENEDALFNLKMGQMPLAQYLKGEKRFQKRTVGEIHQIVHLCVKEKKLGWLKDKAKGKSFLVPYEKSTESQTSQDFSNCIGVEDLHKILKSLMSKDDKVWLHTLPNQVKNLSNGKILKPQSFGKDKLSELLADKPFSEICTVQVHHNGAFLVPRGRGSCASTACDSGSDVSGSSA